MAFKGQIISNNQADWMLRTSHNLNWGYGTVYEKFYAFMETISEEERAVILKALSVYHREKNKE